MWETYLEKSTLWIDQCNRPRTVPREVKNSLITLNVSDVGQCSKGHAALNVQMFQEMFIC